MALNVDHRPGEFGIEKDPSDLQTNVFLFQTQQLTCSGSHSERGARWGLKPVLLSPGLFLFHSLQFQLGLQTEVRLWGRDT